LLPSPWLLLLLLSLLLPLLSLPWLPLLSLLLPLLSLLLLPLLSLSPFSKIPL
jgi:hypothetical protein